MADPHAEKIRTERILVQATGLSRGQLRTRLAEFSKEQARTVDQKKAETVVESGKGFIEHNSSFIEAKPFVEITGTPRTPNNSAGEWYSLTLCDGTTLDVWAQNIVPPAP